MFAILLFYLRRHVFMVSLACLYLSLSLPLPFYMALPYSLNLSFYKLATHIPRPRQMEIKSFQQWRMDHTFHTRIKWRYVLKHTISISIWLYVIR